MSVAIENLIKAATEGKTHKKLGNHYMEKDGDEYRFYYHDTAICVVNEKTGEVSYNSGGWCTVTTMASIDQYHDTFGGYNPYRDPVKVIEFSKQDPIENKGYTVFTLARRIEHETPFSYKSAMEIRAKDPKMIWDLKCCKNNDGAAAITCHFTQTGNCIVDSVSDLQTNDYEVWCEKNNTKIKTDTFAA